MGCAVLPSVSGVFWDYLLSKVVCKKCTNYVAMWKMGKTLPTLMQKVIHTPFYSICDKIELYTKLSTLSTAFVDFQVIYITKKTNIRFVYK